MSSHDVLDTLHSVVWDRQDMQKMWVEAVKWAMGMTQADATPRPKPAD